MSGAASSRCWLAPLILVAFVGGLIVWGRFVHADEPRWSPGQTIPRKETRGLLEKSLTGLSSARLQISLSAPTNADVEALVDLNASPPAAELTVDLASDEDGGDYHARLVGHTAYLRATGATVWSRLPLRSDARGATATFIAQVSGGVDLRGLLTGAQHGLQSSRYAGTTTWGGSEFDTFDLRVAARAVRSRLPALLTQDSDNIRRQVDCTLWLDPAGHLAGFRTTMNDRTVTVIVTQRNPAVSVTEPRRSVPLRTNR